MSAIDNTPENKNFLSPLNFKFTIKKCPHVNFFIQKVNIPDIVLKSPETGNMFVKIPQIGDHIDYGNFSITFKVDEDLQNYLEIHEWIKALGKPKDFDGRRAIRQEPEYTGMGETSDISLIVLSSTKMPNFEVVLVDCWPTSLSSLVFNTVDPDVNYLEASAVFRYTYYDITKI